MVEQPKLLRRPLPPKLSSKLSAPREKFSKGKILGRYQNKAIKSTSDENGETVPSSYFSSQGQDKQTGAFLSNDQVSHSPVQIFSIQKVEQKDCRYFSCLDHNNNDSACWSFSGFPASEFDQYEIIPAHSSGQMPIQSNAQNSFSVRTPTRDIIITKNPSGPDSFPFRKNCRLFHMKQPGLQRTCPTHFSPPIFTLGSLAAISSSHPLPLKTTLKKPVVSRYNCEVLSRRLMTEKRSSQTEVNAVVLSNTDLPLVSTRKSEQQKILESYDVPDGNTMEDVWKTSFQFPVSKQDEEAELMSRSQLEVLRCLLYQKLALNLQGYFLFRLPNLTPLMDTLINLNLSFNNLFFFPMEVLNIKTLEVLVLRNNPIREIPNDIYRLKSLKKFVISFNLLSELPAGLFLLDNLQHLDIAYNDISFIHSDIKSLSFTVCDCCSGPRYGKGLRLIRLYRNVFRFGRLPFCFHACSSSCLRNFMYQSEA
ncbi:leucine-rich repeat-containing protein 63 [Rhea pennata]|uniref:leucine-rich repeat-containing protein 63 n=1 Tax=Rhea pennata TaxID=8795 RepID=UPI002E272DBE